MIPSFSLPSTLLLVSLLTTINAQSTAPVTPSAGYVGYNLSITGDSGSAIYDTASGTTPANVSTTNPPPDVFLNATVHVGEIDILVSNLTAEINLSAQVLNLLSFNAGVDVSIDRVSLLIQNVSAHVLLEARLENLVLMITDVLDSIDLNPVIATLGNDVGSIVNDTVGAVSGAASTLLARDFDLVHNILYSINDYSGNTHTNRILSQSGSIIDQSLDNDGNVHSSTVVGSFRTDMTFNGFNKSMVRDGQVVSELEYVYSPFAGLSVVSAVFVNGTDAVVGTQVLSEARGGGSSSIGDL